MRRMVFFAVLALALSSTLWGSATRDYGTVTLSNWNSGNFGDLWDLTKCDLTLAYTIDMSQIVTAGWAVTEVGLREQGGPNIDPNLVGGWMQSNYINAASNPNSQNMNDMHLLSKHGWLFQTYDATGPSTLTVPYWSNNNYGLWFDRDGVDVWQAALWGAVNEGTYNTGGRYDIVITYHAMDANIATMFATVNSVQQGLHVGGWKNAQPEFYPAGRSFTGDMTQMQVFYGRGGGGGTITVSNIAVTGCLYWTDVIVDVKPGSFPNPINLGSKGVVPVAVLSTPGFDATTILPESVVLAGAPIAKWAIEDVDGDGDADMVFHFETEQLVISGPTVVLTGETTAGLHIRGTDTVRVVPKKK